MYTCDYLRLIEIFWIISSPFFCLCDVFVSTAMIVLYTGVGNVADGPMKDALEWGSCNLKFFFEKLLFCLYAYMCKCN